MLDALTWLAEQVQLLSAPSSWSKTQQINENAYKNAFKCVMLEVPERGTGAIHAHVHGMKDPGRIYHQISSKQ